MVCQCGVPANEAVCRKEGPNNGRVFFGCGNFGKGEETCKFFKWKPRGSARAEAAVSKAQQLSPEAPPARKRSPSLSPPGPMPVPDQRAFSNKDGDPQLANLVQVCYQLAHEMKRGNDINETLIELKRRKLEQEAREVLVERPAAAKKSKKKAKRRLELEMEGSGE